MPLNNEVKKEMEEVSEVKDAKVYEVSIVGEAANEREFLLLKNKNKNGGGRLMSEDIIKEVLNCELENKKEVDEILKDFDISKEGSYALKNMLKIIQTYADVLPKNLLTRLSELLTNAGNYDKEEVLDGLLEKQEVDRREVAARLAEIWNVTTGEAMRFMNAFDPEEPGDRRDIATLVAREYEGLSPVEVMEVLAEAEEGGGDNPEHYDEENNREGEGIMAGIEKNIEDMPDNVRPLIEKLYKEHQETAEKAQKLEKEKIEKQFIEKAKNEFSDLPVETEEFGLLLKSLNQKAPEEFEKLERILKSLNEQISESEMFKEIGSGADESGVGTWGKIEKAAKSIQEANPDLSQAQAVSQVITQNPELYKRYISEEGGNK